MGNVICQTCNGKGVIGGFVNAQSGYQTEPCPECAPETLEHNGVWYDRRDTVDAQTKLLEDARRTIETYKDVIRQYRQKELAENPTPPPSVSRKTA